MPSWWGWARSMGPTTTSLRWTWMQCVPCHPCRPQFNPVFDPTKSLTFHHVPANDGVLCHARYKPPTPASGYLAKETFSFLKGNNEGGLEQLRSIVFGCAHHTAEFDNQNILAGVNNGQGVRFSYCPFTPGMSAYNFLRFGADIPSQPPPSVHRHTILILMRTRNNDYSYYVKLVGVSVGGSRVPGVTPEMFHRPCRGVCQGIGGCVIDIGTKMTAFVHAAYIHIEQVVRLHLQHHGAHFVHLQGHHMCVHQPASHHGILPSMMLHFENGAWLRVMPEHVFMKIVDEAGHQYQCLGLVSNRDMTVIGAIQHINHRFIFDLEAKKPTVSFNPEACHLDAEPPS
ncbi:hypothetical protein VPH35_125693 [Triticum aestivum]